MHSHPDLRTGELPPGVAALGRSGVRDRRGGVGNNVTCGDHHLRARAAGTDKTNKFSLSWTGPLGDCRFARKPTMGPSPPIAEPPDLAVFGRLSTGGLAHCCAVSEEMGMML